MDLKIERKLPDQCESVICHSGMAMERKEPQTTNAHHPTTHDNGGSHKAQKNNQSMKLRRLSGRGKALKFLKRFSIFEIMIPPKKWGEMRLRENLSTQTKFSNHQEVSIPKRHPNFVISKIMLFHCQGREFKNHTHPRRLTTRT